jgi:tetratricopeptide (TPR) repeat protein
MKKQGAYPGKRFVPRIPYIICIICALLARPAGGQVPADPPWWYTLERGKRQFRGGDYGTALLAFEDARRQRRGMYERMEQDFIKFLSLQEVRRLGDSLDRVEQYARERFYTSALAALEELYYRVPQASLNKSAAAALAALGRLKDYPEAEYWIGETYRAEGELGLALGQFQKAREQRSLLENEDFGTELLYKIADIHRTRREYNKMEETLQEIIKGDRLWSGSANAEPAAPSRTVPYAEASASFARQAMRRTLEADGPARFLAMYRYNNTLVEAAHRLLGFYYAVSGRHGPAQEHLMFAFLIQNTVIIEELIRRDYDFEFTGLEDLAPEIQKHPLLSAYAEQTDYYKTAYYLGTGLYGNGKSAAARDMWAFLSVRPEAGEWRSRALGQIRRPHVEPAVEMP